MSIEFETGDPTAEPDLFLDPGEYYFVIADATEETSKNTGKPMLKLKVQLYNVDGTEGPFCFDYVTIAAATKWRVDQFLACIGAHPGNGARVSIDARQYIGMSGYADFKIEEFNGRKGNKVARYIVADDIIEHGRNLVKSPPMSPPVTNVPYSPRSPHVNSPPVYAFTPPPARTSPLPPAFPNGLSDDEIPF